MGTSFTGSLTESRRRMHMIVSAASMRVCGDSLERMTVLRSAFWVSDACATSVRIEWKEKLMTTVTHGLMSRVFLMKWYHFSVEYFEDLRNINHCEFLTMRKSIDSGKYILENNLRTWSQLKQERLAAAKDKDKEKKNHSASSPTADRDREKRKRLEAAAPAQGQGLTHKKWGGCPDGCDHGKHVYKRDNSMHAMAALGRSPVAISPVDPRPPARRRRWQNSSDDDDSEDHRVGGTALAIEVPGAPRRSTDVLSSPDETVSFISADQRVRPKGTGMLGNLGRDFGGSASGNTSVAESDTEGEGKKGRTAKEDELRRMAARLRAERESGMGRGAMADALGDQSDAGSDIVEIDASIEALQIDEGGVQRSVY
jgi:hypothetical protein